MSPQSPSRSSSRRRLHDDELPERRNSQYNNNLEYNERRGESRRSQGNDDRPSRDRDGERNRRERYKEDPDRRSRPYYEGDRERERERDRQRYNARAREGEFERSRDDQASRRRSASPRPRSSRPHSPGSRHPSREPSPVDKTKPNFAPSGLLAAETNTVKAVDGSKTVLKYNEPPEARKPVLGWRLYVFKGSEQVELLHIHRQSAYLVGRDRLVADIAVDHPSCSKQHAVIQYRYVQDKNEFGDSKGVVKPFIIDLESTNSTHVNDEAIPAARYYELKAGDVIKFGQSAREYVLLHDEAT